MSNTATAAMMLTFLTPVLATLPKDGGGRISLALAIPIAANLGGMGTPIGTPPNAIALKYMEEVGINIGFGQWMLFMIPFTLLLLVIAWVMLLKLFPFTVCLYAKCSEKIYRLYFHIINKLISFAFKQICFFDIFIIKAWHVISSNYFISSGDSSDIFPITAPLNSSRSISAHLALFICPPLISIPRFLATSSNRSYPSRP